MCRKTWIDYVADFTCKYLGTCCGHVCCYCGRHSSLHKSITGFLQTKDDQFICNECQIPED